MNIDSSLVRKNQLYLKNIFYHDKKNFMFISNMNNRNNGNRNNGNNRNNVNNNKITPRKTLELLNKIYEIIVHQDKYHMINSGDPIDLNTEISLYTGFYAGFILLMELSDLPDKIKYYIVAKKIIVDELYKKNKNLNIIVDLKIKKTISNRFIDAELKKKARNYIELNKKAQKLSNFNALMLKSQVAELNKSEKNKLERLQQLNLTKALDNIAANMNILLKNKLHHPPLFPRSNLHNA
jgi:hypothetical protein